jgi:rhodanese-related sulfurtransferase
MKKLLLIISIGVFFFGTSCNNAQSKEIKVITPQEVYEAVYDHDAQQLVDVRTPEEFDESHLKNAQNICVTEDGFKEKAAKLDKKKPVYVYCRSGKRSAKAAQILKEMGFTEIYDMDGGILNWKAKGMDTE